MFSSFSMFVSWSQGIGLVVPGCILDGFVVHAVFWPCLAALWILIEQLAPCIFPSWRVASEFFLFFAAPDPGGC